ncbi:MAG TPA: peptide ligase PGM1-related protein [Acidimicrobiia bacterium]|nr:peptide ligase PGM1-related protein [Acidimicrobiia bacterium]
MNSFGRGGGTIVVVPSLTLPLADLAKVTGVVFYEERLLCFLLLLADPDVRVVYTSSAAIDPAIVDYYLRFVPDPGEARRRLQLVEVGDEDLGWLSAKLLSDPAAFSRLRDAIGDPARAWLLPFIATATEHELAEALGVPLDGPPADLRVLGWKSGARKAARQAGVGTLPGSEDLFTVEDVTAAVTALVARRPELEAVVIKLNDCFSGLGNVILEVDGLADPLPTSKSVFCSDEENWPSYIVKMAAQGAIVEELLRHPALRSPSVQLRISEAGAVEILSTHDQILGGPENQVYIGCRFPAHPDYRLEIQRAAVRVGEVLAGEGVVGSFGIDFLVVGEDVYLSEINLRLGGTTHPFWMARLATGSGYDPATGELRRPDGSPRCYVATDNLKSGPLKGRRPADAISLVDRSGLAYDPASATGVALHLLGAVPVAGKFGATCIAETPAAADELYRALLDLVGMDPPSA